MAFVSLNVNGLRDANKRMAVLQWLGHLSVDFACLQETHSLSSDECTSWFSSYGFSSVVSPGPPILVVLPFYFVLVFPSSDPGPILMVALLWQSSRGMV